MLRISVAIAAVLLLGGCVPTVISLPPYTPVGTEEFSGHVDVHEFKYFPKKGVAPDVIHNTAAGELKLTETVGSYYTNAVRREFRQSGLSVKPTAGCSLDGEINDLTIDDLGFSATYITDVRYILWDGDKKTLLDNVYNVKFNTTKYVTAEVIFANINKMISANIAKLMADEAFGQAISQKCGVPS
ncbi:MAG TPA: hypothetical protein VND94_00765 [Terriglobia bacterium]|nr:hypothetical protein [Terriglobia bacterium]